MAEDEPARKEQRFAELSTGWGIGTAGLATETVWAQLDAREQGRRMTNATRVVPEVWAGDTGKAPEDIESHGGRTEGSGKSAGWKLAPAAALKARSKATNRWLSMAAHFGNLHEVSRKVSASARAPDAALNRKFALTPNPDPVWLVAAAMKAVSSVSNVWLAERLTMGRPASVSQYVRRFRPCRRSDCGMVQGSAVTGQCVTPFSPCAVKIRPDCSAR